MKLSARNQFPGKVVEVTEGAVNGIVKIEIAPGLVISSSITNAAIEELPEGWLRGRSSHQGFQRDCWRRGLIRAVYLPLCA